jgi:hypothetical protein
LALVSEVNFIIIGVVAPPFDNPLKFFFENVRLFGRFSTLCHT